MNMRTPRFSRDHFEDDELILMEAWVKRHPAMRKAMQELTHAEHAAEVMWGVLEDTWHASRSAVNATFPSEGKTHEQLREEANERREEERKLRTKLRDAVVAYAVPVPGTKTLVTPEDRPREDEPSAYLVPWVVRAAVESSHKSEGGEVDWEKATNQLRAHVGLQPYVAEED